MYLKAKSFVRDLSEISYSQLTAEMIRELKKELNDNNMDLTKLYGFKNKTSKLVTEILKKGFCFTNSISLNKSSTSNDIDAPNNIKQFFNQQELF